MRRVALLACLATIAACGGHSDASKPELTVSAAASLKTAVTDYARGFDAATVRTSFAGSDELAAQIRQGVKPDVFASANTKLPDQLYAEGLVEKPVVFAANQLVLAVPADGEGRRASTTSPSRATTIAMGSESVPVGAYTRKVLDGLPAARAQGDPGQRALQRARRRRRRRQGRPGRGRRRLRLRHRRRRPRAAS